MKNMTYHIAKNNCLIDNIFIENAMRKLNYFITFDEEMRKIGT